MRELGIEYLFGVHKEYGLPNKNRLSVLGIYSTEYIGLGSGY